jgi:predicted nucleic acid-binding protein
MYLLDTDTIIYNFKGHAAVQENLRHHLYDPLRISVVTLMELYYGAYKSQKTASNLAKLKTLENSLEIIPLGKECVEIFGMLKANLEKAGTPTVYGAVAAQAGLSFLCEAGVPVKYIQAVLRHKKLSTTERYLHRLEDLKSAQVSERTGNVVYVGTKKPSEEPPLLRRPLTDVVR